MGDVVKKLLMFSDIEGCQASPGEQSKFLCSDAFYDKLGEMLNTDKGLHIAFLGDYFDQGMLVYESITGMMSLLDNPNFAGRVHVILGNRDVNKLRFCFELRYRIEIKNSIENMTSKNITTLEVIEETKATKDGKLETVKKCPEFDKGWKSWSPHFFGIYKDEIIDPPNYTVKGKIEDTSDVGLVKHILMSSMGANKTEKYGTDDKDKMTGLYSFMPYDKIANATEEDALKYLKASLGIIPKDNIDPKPLDLLGFFQKCKLAHVFEGPDGKGKVLLAHGGGFDPEAFFDKAYVDFFGQGMKEIVAPGDYHTTLEAFRRQLSGVSKGIQAGGEPLQINGTALTLSGQRGPTDRERRIEYNKKIKNNTAASRRQKSRPVQESKPVQESESVPVSESVQASNSVQASVEAYNTLLKDVLKELAQSTPKFTWKFVLLQALGLKPDNVDARYKSLIQSCSQDGCSGPNEPLTTDPIDEITKTTKLAKILKDSGITHVSYGHKPICFPIPVIYRREEVPDVTFISNDTSNGNRKVEEIGENTAIGTMVIFGPNGVQSKIEPIELNGREGKVDNYKEMYEPLTFETTPMYEQPQNGANFLKYGTKKVVFNNLLKKEPPIIAYGPLKFKDNMQPEPAATTAGGRRRSRNRKRNTKKRGSKRVSKRTRRNKHHTKHSRKMRKQ